MRTQVKRNAKFSRLNPDYILETTQRLEQRIGERFKGSGLAHVAAEMRALGEEVAALVGVLRRPAWAIRMAGLASITVVLSATLLIFVFTFLSTTRVNTLADAMQTSEAFLNEIVLVGLAVLFFGTMESRYKRRLALKSLHSLRSIIHVVDMHQLTKDPESSLGVLAPTASSPQRAFTRDQLARYLNYCSELFSLSSKLAALHVDFLTDEVVLEAVSDIERLAAALSQKVWQKITILDAVAPSLATPLLAAEGTKDSQLIIANHSAAVPPKSG